MKKYFIIFAALFLFGCVESNNTKPTVKSADDIMIERIPFDAIRIFTDELGRKYIVRHRTYDTFYISPYDVEVLK